MSNLTKVLMLLIPILGFGQSTNENFINNRIYTKPVKTQGEIDLLKPSESLNEITYFDGLGRPIQKTIYQGGGGEVIPSNEMTYDWELGKFNTDFYNMNGSQSENLIENGITPFGTTDLLWKCGNDAASDADGGWNTDYFNIDNTKTYRYTVWVKITGFRTDGYTYHGTQYVNNLDNSPNPNPYFWAGNLPQISKWYLLVGIVHPHNYSGGDTGESGVYDLNGNKVLDGTEFKWQSSSSTTRFRNYLYYSTNISVRQYFYKPLLQIKNGSEWKIAEIINNSQSEDLITHINYDNMGRQDKFYLPYGEGKNSLNYRNNAENLTKDYYKLNYPLDIDSNSPNPYGQTKFDNSPLSKVVEKSAQGKDWSLASGHTVKYEYNVNMVNDSIKYYSVEFVNNETDNPKLKYNGLYANNLLVKTTTKNENWKSANGRNNSTEEYQDKYGNIILKRAYSNGVYHDTQYVYDDFGNLTFVLSPKGSDLVMTQYSYQFWGKSISGSSLVPIGQTATGSGYISVSVNPTTKQFTLNANANFSASIPLKTGTLLQLNQNVPNTELGSIGTYKFVLEDGYLKMFSTSRSITPVSSLSGTLTSTLAEYSIHQNQIDDLCYQYKYDNRNRLIKKKLPQKGWEYIVYNKLDQPVLTQDYNLRGQNKWLFTKYDAFNRPVYTGVYTHNEALNQETMQGVVDNHATMVETKTSAIIHNGTSIYYTNNAFPNGTALDILTINYYDDYSFDTVLQPQSGTIYGKTISTATKSLATGTKVRVLDTNHWISKIMQYDDEGHTIYSATYNDYLQTTDKVKSKYDFVGNIIETEVTHNKGSNTPIIIKDLFTYDHQNRLLMQTQTINGVNPEVIVNNEYDELGQIKSKRIGHKKDDPLQEVDFIHNIRGWLTGVNDVNNLQDDLFGFKVNYNKVAEGTATNEALYNGNISQTIWKTASDDIKRGYAFKYDELNRISDAHFRKGNNLDTDAGHFDTHGLTYDKNGNILKLKRNANSNTLIDNLDYSYNGNQLTKVDDTSSNAEGFKDGNTANSDYTYDQNGNMLKDLNKNITSINYNHLNLPRQIEFGAGGVDGKIVYIYDAAGIKLAKKVETAGANSSLIITLYAGNFNYVNNDLQFISHPEGYVEDTQDSSKPFIYFYQLKDHLGNIRVSFNDTDKDGKIDVRRGTTDIDGDGDLKNEIVEEHNYYPYGLKHKGYNNVVNGRPHKYMFGGKEYQDEKDLAWYDVSARNYDPALGRWMNLDPLAEEMRSWSPYNYAFNSPLQFIDPDGNKPEWKPNKNGYIVSEPGDGAASLSKFLNISEVQAQRIINASGLTILNKTGSFVLHDQTIKINTNITRGLEEANSREGITNEEVANYVIWGTKPENKIHPNDVYNCTTFAYSAKEGYELGVQNKQLVGMGRFAFGTMIKSSQYTTEGSPVFGKSIYTWGTTSVEHAAIYYGTDNQNNIYVLTKNGDQAQPSIMKLSELEVFYGKPTKLSNPVNNGEDGSNDGGSFGDIPGMGAPKIGGKSLLPN